MRGGRAAAREAAAPARLIGTIEPRLVLRVALALALLLAPWPHLGRFSSAVFALYANAVVRCLPIGSTAASPRITMPTEAQRRDPAVDDWTVMLASQAASAYLFNGANPNGTLTLARGQTYAFNVTVSGHPFHITTAPGLPTQDFVDAGLTGQGAQASALTFAVPASAPSTLFYQCGIHTAMTGSINIVAASAVPATSPWALAGFGALVILAGGLAIRRRLSSAR